MAITTRKRKSSKVGGLNIEAARDFNWKSGKAFFYYAAIVIVGGVLTYMYVVPPA